MTATGSRSENNPATPGQCCTPVDNREDLLAPSHTLEEPLRPATACFWSIRARFLIDGQLRVSDWGQQLVRRIEFEDTQPEKTWSPRRVARQLSRHRRWLRALPIRGRPQLLDAGLRGELAV
jgi:hypothetical protein